MVYYRTTLYVRVVHFTWPLVVLRFGASSSGCRAKGFLDLWFGVLRLELQFCLGWGHVRHVLRFGGCRGLRDQKWDLRMSSFGFLCRFLASSVGSREYAVWPHAVADGEARKKTSR